MSPDNKTPPRPGEGATGLRTGLEVLRTPTRSIFDILAAVESTQKSLPGIKIGQSPPKPCTEAAWCGLRIRTTIMASAKATAPTAGRGDWGRHSNAPSQGATVTGATINAPSEFAFLCSSSGSQVSK